MKATKIISLVVMIMGTSVLFMIQDVPEPVSEAFAIQFPTASFVQWEQESENEWEADFKMEKVAYSVNYLEDGTWMETEYEMALKDLPKNLIEALTLEFPDYEIDEAEKLQTAHGTAYEFELEKGGDKIEIITDANGKVLKMEKEDDDNNEN